MRNLLTHGLARARCGDCGHDFLIAFSCEGRGVCPACNTCRMAETAAPSPDAIEAIQTELRQRTLRSSQRRRWLERGDRLQMEQWIHGGGLSLDASVFIRGGDHRGREGNRGRQIAVTGSLQRSRQPVRSRVGPPYSWGHSSKGRLNLLSVDDTGRIRKDYRYDRMMTLCDKLRSLPHAAQYLKPGTTFEPLDAIAFAISDYEAAQRLNQARAERFRSIHKTQNSAA